MSKDIRSFFVKLKDVADKPRKIAMISSDEDNESSSSKNKKAKIDAKKSPKKRNKTKSIKHVIESSDEDEKKNDSREKNKKAKLSDCVDKEKVVEVKVSDVFKKKTTHRINAVQVKGKKNNPESSNAVKRYLIYAKTIVHYLSEQKSLL